MSKTVDVIIPVYKPGDEFQKALHRLESQSIPVHKIYLMHTMDGMDLLKLDWITQYDNICVTDIDPMEFDHGGTRNQGMELSHADYVLCMTQDAIPCDKYLIEQLLDHMEEGVAVAYGRQLPRKDCGFIERYTRSFNYPEVSRVKSSENLEELGIKAFFCSNVCAMYDSSIYKMLGGFEKKTIFNEDMIYAAGCIDAGYKIAYVAEAKVVHSHNYTNIQQFKRNFDLAVSQADHPEIFEKVKSESEGIKMVKSTALYLIKAGRPWLVVSLVLSSAAKYLGYFTGKRYHKLSGKIIMKCTMNPRYWG